MVGYKRKYPSSIVFAGRRVRQRTTAARTFPTRVTYGVARTGGNYNPVYRRWDSRMGSYRVGPGPERKFIDVASSVAIVSYMAAGQFLGSQSGGWSTPILLNGLAPGTDATARIGRKVLMKSFYLRTSVSFTNDTAISGGVPPPGAIAGQFRQLVVYDSQSNGVAPAAADILQGTGGQAVVSPLNLNNRERFKVLSDKVRNLDIAGPGAIQIKVFKKLNLPIIFNGGTSGGIGDIQTGSVYILFSTNVQATAAGALGPDFYSRVRFLDD